MEFKMEIVCVLAKCKAHFGPHKHTYVEVCVFVVHNNVETTHRLGERLTHG